jgi:hypothetical protein
MVRNLRIPGIVVALVVSTLMLLPAPVQAQQKRDIEITPIAGWFWSGYANGANGELDLNNTGGYGAAIGVEVRRGYQIEFQYTYAASEASFSPYYPGRYPSGKVADVNIHYFQLGGLRIVDRGKVQPFGLFSLGATWFSPTAVKGGVQAEDEVRFSIALGGGLKIWLSDKIGLRIQGRLLMPVYFAGTSVYMGTGGGGVAVSGGVPILQGDVAGGLIFAL